MNNMIAQGRSTKFCNIFSLVMDKYNHILVWPCMCKKRNKEYDFLKPPYRFYNFLNVAGIFILWTIIVFVTALIAGLFGTLETVNIIVYILLLVLCGFIASPLTMVVIWLFYKVYLVNIQAAFTRSIVSDRYKQLGYSDKASEDSRVLNETEKKLEPEDLEPVSYTHLEPTRPLYISYAVFCLKKKK